MLPGLVYTDIPSFYICKAIEDMKCDFLEGTLKNYVEYEKICSLGCQEFHLSNYLYCLWKLNKKLDDGFVKRCLESRAPKARLYAVRIVLEDLAQKMDRRNPVQAFKHRFEDPKLFKEVVKRYINDPFNEIRQLGLRALRISKVKVDEETAEAILGFISDQNTGVRIEAVRLLSRLEIKNKRVEKKILEEICGLITDQKEEVRLSAARSLKYLNFSSPGSLFAKSRNGVFIYGLEDECMRVRQETVKSIFFLCNEDIKNETFDFLVDLLNDDSQQVRILVSSVLKKLSKKFIWKIPPGDLNLVIINLEESNRKINRNLLRFCGRLHYTEDTFCIFQVLLDKVSLGKNIDEIYRCIRKIARRNLQLLYSNHAKIYQVDDRILGREPSVLDKTYVAKLMLFDILNRNKFKIAFPKFFSEHFMFLKLKLERNKSKKKEFEHLKREFILMIGHIKKDPSAIRLYKRAFCFRYRTEDHKTFFTYLYRASCRFLQKESKDMLEYTFCRFNLCFSDEKARDLESLKTTISEIRYEKVKFLNFSINFPAEIDAIKGQNIDFAVDIEGPAVAKECFLRIEEPLTGARIYYRIAKCVRVFINKPFLMSIGMCIVKRRKIETLMSEYITVPIKWIDLQ